MDNMKKCSNCKHFSKHSIYFYVCKLEKKLIADLNFSCVKFEKKEGLE